MKKRSRSSNRSAPGPARSRTKAELETEDPLLESILRDVARVYERIPHLKQLRDEVLFGDVWKRPELSPRDRSLITCAMLAALGRHDELRTHVRRAEHNGVSKKELQGLAVHVAFYAGWPAGLAVGRAALAYLE